MQSSHLAAFSHPNLFLLTLTAFDHHAIIAAPFNP
jgi:hypothetical protein